MVSVDNSYVSKYNTAKGTKYGSIPPEDIDLINSKLTIPKDSMASSDSVNIKIKSSALDKLTEAAYLIPIKISEASGGNAAASTNMNVTYVIVTTETNNINDAATETDIRGALVSDRSGWTAVSSPTNSTTNRLFDGNNSTYFSLSSYTTSSADLTLTIDMSKSFKISGLNLNYRGNAASSYLSGVSVYVSQDNTTWTTPASPKHNHTKLLAIQAVVKIVPLSIYIKITELTGDAIFIIFLSFFNIIHKFFTFWRLPKVFTE